jgi:predicted RecA/RadA family phage recombinase
MFMLLVGFFVMHIMHLFLVQSQAVQNFLNDDCDIYIAASKYIATGRAVIAGKWFKVGDHIDRGLAIEVPHWFIQSTQLSNYVFAGSRESTSLVVVGINMLINHHDQYNSEQSYANCEGIYPDAVDQALRHFNVQVESIDRAATRAIGPGDEVFGNYGLDHSWFTDRGINIQPSDYDIKNHRYSLLLLKANGVCYSNLVIAKSRIAHAPQVIANSPSAEDSLLEDEFDYFGDFLEARLNAPSAVQTTLCVPADLRDKLEASDGAAGQGVFSKQLVKSGDLVTMSPLLVLPLHTIVAGSGVNSTLINHCLASSDSLGGHTTSYSDVCLLPIGTASFINHAPISGRESMCLHGARNVTANVAIEWFAFNSYSAADACALSAAVSGANPELYCDLAMGADFFESNRNKSTRLDLLLSNRTSLQELEHYPYAPLDIGYRAIRDIAPGDELYLDYGSEWEAAFSAHLQRMSEYYEQAKASDSVLTLTPPLFRHPLKFPDDIFPEHWRGVECLGALC